MLFAHTAANISVASVPADVVATAVAVDSAAGDLLVASGVLWIPAVVVVSTVAGISTVVASLLLLKSLSSCFQQFWSPVFVGAS